MIRAHEKLIAWRSGILSVLVHCILLAILLVSFNWKAVQPASIAQVELWDSLPAVTPAAKPVVPTPKPEPEPKPIPPPEPKPEPKPAPEAEPMADIQVKKEPIKEPKPVEKPKPDPAIKARQEEQKRKEALKLKEEQKRELEQKRKAEQQRQLADLQKAIAEEDKAAQQERQAAAQASAQSAAASAASASEMDKYTGLISSKIKSYVNPQLCGASKVELKFHIALIPTGELAANPKLLKSSGIAACDQAVERAILQAQPLPLPTAPELRARFRDIDMPFYPNGR